MSVRARFLIAVFGLGLCRAAVAAPPSPPIDIGSRRELFVDRLLIERMTGAELRLQRPVDRGSVLQFDAPWEGRFCAYVTVVRSPDKFQIYYRGMDGGKDTDAGQVTCYAESADGITWIKPKLDLFPIGENKLTNVVLARATPVTHNFCP